MPPSAMRAKSRQISSALKALGVPLACRPTARFVVCGSARGPSSSFGFALARYNADGSPDATFGAGQNGKVTTPVFRER